MMGMRVLQIPMPDHDDAGFMQSALMDLKAGRSLTEGAASRMMHLILGGVATTDVIVGYLKGLAAKGPAVDEIVGSVRALRATTAPLNLPFDVLDTCGTGGDGGATFNISTFAALVTAAAGQPVAKHGNRSSSGGVGSADVLQALGVSIDLSVPQIAASLTMHRFAFLFAPRFRPPAPRVRDARRLVPGPTMFNLAGPLSNPARPAHQIIGSFSERVAQTLAEAAQRLGTRQTFVVAGPGGVDEFLPAEGNVLFEVTPESITRHLLGANHAGVPQTTIEELRGGDARKNARIGLGILCGQWGAPRDAVTANAGLALWVSGRAENLRHGVIQSRRAIDDGSALDLLIALRRRAEEGGSH